MKSVFLNGKDENIWSQEDRDKFRTESNLPILQSKAEFIKRLKRDRVLVVIAETGSGKSTQLPQYMAEAFEEEEGLIVVTQPRALAAISVAERVAYEFDGPEFNSTGYSVGYKVGKNSSLNKNNRILFMTDFQLIREMGEDDHLSKVRCLLIDEAHERSINTDIVLGIAKHLLEKRKDNFYVVVASATIDPKEFLKFFEKSNQEPLKVPGRVYPVNLHYWPKQDNSNDNDEEDNEIGNIKDLPKFVVNKTLEAVEKFNKGHTLVFLPGQAEIEKCVKFFSEMAQDNFEVLPLYGSLSPEDQMQIIGTVESYKNPINLYNRFSEQTKKQKDSRFEVTHNKVTLKNGTTPTELLDWFNSLNEQKHEVTNKVKRAL